jgi:aminopeptidase N
MPLVDQASLYLKEAPTPNIEEQITQLMSQVSPLYLEVMGGILNESFDDAHYKAQLVTLPSEHYIVEQVKEVDPEAIYMGVKAVKKAVAYAHSSQFKEIYHQLGHDASPAYIVYHMGRRKLRNTCLDYLSLSELKTEAIDLAYQQFNDSLTVNMTDCLMALSTLNHFDVPQRQEALDAFYQQWNQASLVMNKWFAVQAQSTLPNALSHIEGLLAHPDFSIENPNNVYALVHGFASSNLLCFHDRSG